MYSGIMLKEVNYEMDVNRIDLWIINKFDSKKIRLADHLQVSAGKGENEG